MPADRPPHVADQQFMGRRNAVMQEELHARRNRRFQAMVAWLEAQARVNVEEGTHRELRTEADPANSGPCQGEQWEGSAPGPGLASFPEEPQRSRPSFE